jgi:hypothetical protein
VVSGLPLDKPECAVLGIYFTEVNEHVSEAIQICFPLLSRIPSFLGVFMNCLSNVVGHELFLQKELENSHPLFQTPLFTRQLYIGLKDFVSQEPSLERPSTGIPPHISILASLQSLGGQMNTFPEEILKGVKVLLEESGTAAGNITREHLLNTLQEALQNLGFSGNSPSVDRICVTQSSTDPESFPPFFRDGEYFRTPNGFRLPKVNLLTAWSLWWKGHHELGVPPYRVLKKRDMTNSNEVKLLSEWNVLFAHIKVLLEESGQWKSNPTDLELGSMYASAMELLPIPRITPKNKRRRVGQLSLTSILGLVREKKKTYKNI